MCTQPQPDHLGSFYHLRGTTLERDCCRGLACFVARHLNPANWEKALTGEYRVHCLGKCYRAPATVMDETSPRFEIHAPRGIVLQRLVKGGAAFLNQYIDSNGYQALRKALASRPVEIVRQLEISELRGRGGAGFPSGKKWYTALNHEANEKHIVANADEGDPGAYIDRFLLEDDPHSVIEAMVLAGYAVGASRGWIYLKKEYPLAAIRLRRALDEARAQHLLGVDILGSSFSFEVDLVVGEGSYVCGEETCLLNALEGKRPEARIRPPYPADRGLFGKPTLVNNIETLVNVPWIVLHGGDAYRALGFSRSRGTKAISLNSLFRRPGLYEVEFGMPIRQIVDQIGGGLASGTLHGVIIGGPLAGILPPRLLDTPFAFEELRAVGADVGHGGIVAFDEHTSIVDLLQHVFDFGAFESCGKCTPCRLGTRRVLELLDGKSGGGKAEFQAITEALRATSLCAMGTGLGQFASSVLRYYERDLSACLT